ncbi:hypothetical protein PF008_g19789 [Phytophthora fragariae]|uniref:Uncharacterized protein n=1 Tax=Phytophthora fragariae TaxID=53985 RepID=A0A6G0R1D4_9STRA|nr:hypothetical protein PF008_g19789 [Phytophthora fragariae]
MQAHEIARRRRSAVHWCLAWSVPCATTARRVCCPSPFCTKKTTFIKTAVGKRGARREDR